MPIQPFGRARARLSLHAAAASAQRPSPARHPLDPLTSDEIAATVAVLTRAGRVRPGAGGRRR